MPVDEARGAVGVPRPGGAPGGERVVVCGLQELSLSIVEQLLASGVEVVVVDEQPAPRLRALLEDRGVPLLEGSPRAAATLRAAGAAEATAVVCVAESDLATLETALVAHGLRQGMRVVVQMSNHAVARALEVVTGPGTALDVADLAAPALVQACLGAHRRALELAGERFAVFESSIDPADLEPTSGTTLRDRFGDLVPIAVVAAGGDVDVCPGRDRPLHGGDRVVLLGPAGDVPAEELGETTAEPAGLRRVLPALAQVLAAAWRWSDRRVRSAALALLAVVVLATVVIHFAYRPPGGSSLGVLTSLYFTVETVATVGFGDFSFATQSAWLQGFGILLIVLGVSLVTTMFALLTNLLVSRAVAQALGRSRAVRMRRHVVVVGLGSIGVRVVELLLGAGRRVVVVERDADNRHLGQVRALGVPTVLGDATEAVTLDEANVRAASAVAVLTSDELTNLETGLSLRDYLAGAEVVPPVVLRVFDRSFARSIERSFELRDVHSTSALAAPWFVGAALGLDILLTFAVEQERLLVARLRVAPTGGLAGVAMGELSARIRVVAIRRASDGRLEHPPRRGTQFQPDDEAYLIGPYEELLRVLRRDAPVPPAAPGGVPGTVPVPATG